MDNTQTTGGILAIAVAATMAQGPRHSIEMGGTWRTPMVGQDASETGHVFFERSLFHLRQIRRLMIYRGARGPCQGLLA